MIPVILFGLMFQTPQVYTIAGTLVDSVTNAPIAKAKVVIAGAGFVMANPLVSRTSATGPDGHFEFTGLAAQKYTLTATRLGYIPQRFGERALYADYTSAVVTGEGQTTDHLTFRLIPSAVIAGTVTDPNGQPVAGLAVGAMAIGGSGPRRRVLHTFSGSTDDRGYFRIYSLPEGTFGVVVSGQQANGQPVPSVDAVAYPRTFYPGTTDPEQAALVNVKAGQEVRADMILRPVPAGQ